MYVAGISGQLSARVVRALLTQGVQVVAGVPEDDPAADALQFAVQYELLKKQEASKLQIREIDFGEPDSYGIPKGAAVLVVLGDVQGRKKMTDKQVQQAVSAAIDADAGRIVLATPLGGASGGGGGGFFSALFGGGGGGASVSRGTGDLRLSRTEQQVYDSGVPFTIVRYGSQPNEDVAPAGGIQLTPAGDTGKSAVLGRDAAASVIAQALLQSDPAESYVLEASVSPAEIAGPIPEAVAEVLPSAEVEVEEEEEEEEEEEAPPPVRAARGAASRASRFAQQAAEDSDDEDDEEDEGLSKSSSPAFDLKSFFGGRGLPKAEEVEDEVEEAAEEVAKPVRSLFGGRPQQAKKEAQQTASAAQRAAASAGRKAASAASRGARQASKEVEEAAPKQQSGSVFRSLLGLDDGKDAEDDAADEAPAAPKRPFSFGGGTKVLKSKASKPAAAAPQRPARPAKQAAPARGRAAEKKEDSAAPSKKSGGFLKNLGFNQDTVYADED